MASEMFHAVFSVHFDARYNTSNELSWRWWVNENICDFIMSTYLHSDLPQPCTAWCEGHHPKMLLWIMEEFFYISQQLTDEDCDGHIVLGYELMLEAEHRFRIKWDGGIGRHRSLSHSTSNALPCSQETLDHVTWSNPDSRMLECLMWSVYDGILTPGPKPKLVGPISYHQVLKCLATKVYRGLQVCCSARTQFNEPPLHRVRSVVLILPQHEGAKKAETMDTASPKDEDIEEGAMGVK